jgi:hypothetical protein
MHPLQFCTEAEFNAAPVIIRARSQIARLQAVIDYGVGDVSRAVKIRDILEDAIMHCREHGAYVAVNGNPVLLDYTLHDWAPAICSCCAELERMQVAA